MKRIELLFLVAAIALVSCVDDFSDANPPSFLDSPAVSALSISDTIVAGGNSTTVTVAVSDAPAGLDSVAVSAVDDASESVGGTFSLGDYEGLTSGSFDITYTLPDTVSGEVTINVVVYDGQTDENGDLTRKSSVLQSTSFTAICGDFAGVYDVSGDILVDDFGSGPYAETNVVLFSPDCNTGNLVQVPDITGGLYTGSYADNYGTSARVATLTINTTTDVVTWTGVSDQFGGSIIQDGAQPDSNIDPGTGEITIYWTATAFGERGVTTFTLAD
ncbi:MAG: hypothetical protein RLN88_13615 [Ekhidna sp.]|uniref:hypothetical protein n=1 Tax=Ekhidna sp. TaxID=2608089 RepID=UPI0032EDAC3A